MSCKALIQASTFENAPTYSVIIPAFDEEDLIASTLRELKQAMNRFSVTGEVVVVDNNSSDNTAAIARNEGAIVVFEPYNQISKARNTGAKVAKGRFLIFLDADTWISDVLLGKTLLSLFQGKICGGGARVNLQTELKFTAKLLVSIWDKLSRGFNLAPGCFIFCSRRAFENIGGFSEKLYAAEELVLSFKLQRWGKKHDKKFQVIRCPRIITSPRKLEWYTSRQLILSLLAFTGMPMALFFRPLCQFWYQRPNRTGKKTPFFR